MSTSSGTNTGGLSRRVGVQHIEAVEDAVQSALMKALDAWLPAVNKILYLLFTEGYLASHTGNAIRRELCDEAIRLTAILAQHPIGQVPQTFALLALMHLHVACMTSRQDASGGLLLLEEQDRALWDQQRIQVGLEWLAKSACGDKFSRYHAEAGIAAEHCLASSFEETRWDKIVQCYRLLEETAPSAIHRLNRSIAVAEWQGPAAGLTVLKGFRTAGLADGILFVGRCIGRFASSL